MLLPFCQLPYSQSLAQVKEWAAKALQPVQVALQSVRVALQSVRVALQPVRVALQSVRVEKRQIRLEAFRNQILQSTEKKSCDDGLNIDDLIDVTEPTKRKARQYQRLRFESR
jgi:hypothetical protein